MDSVGIVVAGLAGLFLVFILLGHQKREHMSNQKSKWNTIQRSVEESLKEKYDFNIAEFRKNSADQKAFFDRLTRELSGIQKALGVNLALPEVKEMKDTSRPFDERYRLIDEDVATIIKSSKDAPKDPKAKVQPSELLYTELGKNAKAQLISLAKLYMIIVCPSVKPKTALSAISKIIG